MSSDLAVADYVYDAGQSAPSILNIKTADLTTSGTITANVPEPTSAMLLVLGLAGLALRRRRA